MMPTEEQREEGPGSVSDRRLWKRSRTIDAPDDEAARFLDLAAFADGLLDAEDHDRVAALLTGDPQAAADVQAARSLDAAGQSPAEIERVIARACAILSDASPAPGKVVALLPLRGRRVVEIFAQWGSLAAAVIVAGWLGFAMGSDTSLALSAPRQVGDASFLPELFDSASGLLRDLGEGLRT
jgi:anti-sigma factor RsiW